MGLRAVALGSSQGTQEHTQGGWEEREVRGEVGKDGGTGEGAGEICTLHPTLGEGSLG